MCTNRRPVFLKQAGFSLIELIFFIVVVAVGMTGILMVMQVSVKSSADPMVRKQTVAIAESLLEEILQKDYVNPAGGYTGPNRALFDDVNDYVGYTTAGGMVDITGAAIAGLGQYNVAPAVAVVPITLGPNAIPALQVTVTVTGPGGPIALTGLRTNN
jgi:MSHA pilin protein MshD